MLWRLAYLLCVTQICLFISLCSAVVKAHGAVALLAGQLTEGLWVFSCFLKVALWSVSSISHGPESGGQDSPEFVEFIVGLVASRTDIRLS
jgi:hypothetical protein